MRWRAWRSCSAIELLDDTTNVTGVVFANPEDFHGGVIISDEAWHGSSVVIIPFVGMPNAALCVLAMYQDFAYYRGIADTAKIVSNPQEVAKALRDGKSHIIVV